MSLKRSKISNYRSVDVVNEYRLVWAFKSLKIKKRLITGVEQSKVIYYDGHKNSSSSMLLSEIFLGIKTIQEGLLWLFL